MENTKLDFLRNKLRDTLIVISYKYGSNERGSYVVFLDSSYKEALSTPIQFQIIDSSKEASLEIKPYETYLGLNGDIIYICWVENKGIDNIDVFIKVK